ncbi:acyltransferase [Nocardioides zeae]|uniref:Acyltransferase n=1 Tax=Nocardioides imazamoxiresistens TaxID=3231893 RepID=A0ABU3PVD0_9ACTN|nr:acyltransferase [Nocardioides zeae]MDT9593183.1 acyltransferase [Nocardioides zeae]
MSTPTTTAPRQGTTAPGAVRYPLGWLRALAALSVVTFHAYQWNRTGPEGTWPLGGGLHQLMTGTDLFVDLFFVLSGFVLWVPVARAVLDGADGRPGWVVLVRRLARLLPLYVTVVLVVWAATNPSLPGHWQDLVLHLTFTHVYSDTYIFWTNGPAWSLAVEFHFYVLVALAIPVVRRLARRAHERGQRLLLTSALPALLVAVGVGYTWWVTQVLHPDPTDWSVLFSPVGKAADFGVGMLLAVAAAAGVRLRAGARGLLAVAGVAALVLLAASRPHDVDGLWWHPAYALAITAALAAIVLHDGPWPTWMSWGPLAWLGGLGYGIYLIHEPVMRLLGWLGLLPEPAAGLVFVVTAAVVAVPTVALAWLSSRTVEAAGADLLALIEADGRRRDYYAHLGREV